MTTKPTLTLLDYFAGQALAAIAAEEGFSVGSAATAIGMAEKDYVAELHFPQFVAKRSYDFAEAMLAERAKRQPTPGKPAAGPELLASASPAPSATAAENGNPASNSLLAPLNQRLDAHQEALEQAGLLPEAEPASYATTAQKEEIIRRLNHPAISRADKAKGLLRINRPLTEAAATDYLAELQTAIDAHNHGKGPKRPAA